MKSLFLPIINQKNAHEIIKNGTIILIVSSLLQLVNSVTGDQKFIGDIIINILLAVFIFRYKNRYAAILLFISFPLMNAIWRWDRVVTELHILVFSSLMLFIGFRIIEATIRLKYMEKNYKHNKGVPADN